MSTIFKKSDLKVETMRGTGKGGQHRNKTDSAVRITHIPTGLSAYADERSQHHSRKLAMKELEKRVKQVGIDKKAKHKKADRDYKIHNTPIIRTYDFKAGIVKDHRSKKRASIKEVMNKGRVDLVQPDKDVI